MIVAHHILRAARLCAAVHALWSREIPRDRACAASVAITLTAGREDPALIAAIAVKESRMQRHRVNPRTGACGSMQVIAYPRRTRRAACAAMRADEVTDYAAGVERLRAWRRACRRRDVACALRGYGGGAKGAAGVEWRRRAIRRELTKMSPPVRGEGRSGA